MNNIILTPREIIEIKQLAKDMRAAFGVNDEVPIANDIKMFLDKQGILLCEYPFQENSKIDAEIVRFETDNKPLIFIGLNSSLYYDEQIFALAHEIYHFKTETGKAYNIDKNTEDDRIEKRADRFAAELLLPEGVLRSYVILEFGQDGIESNNILGILRFIAGIQLTWWLPYKSIVLRLREEGLIDQALFNELYNNYDSRSESGDYYKILRAMDGRIADILNSKTCKTTVSQRVIDVVLKNYDDEYLAEDEFVDLMNLFHVDPSDYGYEMGLFDDDDYNFKGDFDED